MKHGIYTVFDDGHLRDYSKHQIILYQGEKTHDVFYIQSGYIKVYDITASGTEKLVLILGPGDVFPLLWTFRGVSALHYFYETIDNSTLKVIDCDDFIELIKKKHQITKNMLQYFVNTTKDLMSRVDCIEASSAKHKVAQVLSYLALSHGQKTTKESYKLELPITHQLIANMAGISRETASLQLKELETEKMFDVIDDSMLIHLKRIDSFLDSI